MNEPHVWIVEILERSKWQPTVGCGLYEADARMVMREWRLRLPDDKFRVTKYTWQHGKRG
jgi:hypothetical protein